jgi:hypothetical protein
MNWGKTRIDLNKLFEEFTNLELSKISLNIQIQTKYLNGRLLNDSGKDLKMEFKIFQKAKST